MALALPDGGLSLPCPWRFGPRFVDGPLLDTSLDSLLKKLGTLDKLSG